MSEFLYGLADCGGSLTRVAVVDGAFRVLGVAYSATDPSNYQGTVEGMADTMNGIATGRGELVAASIAVAGELDDQGRIVRAGDLTPWLGCSLSSDVAVALELPTDRVGGLNDLEAVALSQVAANEDNDLLADGVVMTLSSGWGGARYTSEGKIMPDEPGHQHLRGAALCPCGGEGHAEAYISGKGVLKNQGMDMRTWLENPDAVETFVADVSTAVVDMIERHQRDGFTADELRWMGGVAAGQPAAMWRAYQQVRRELGEDAPLWEAVSLGHQAGLHGTFVDAQRRAQAA